jgi:hypothetical protein
MTVSYKIKNKSMKKSTRSSKSSKSSKKNIRKNKKSRKNIRSMHGGSWLFGNSKKTNTNTKREEGEDDKSKNTEIGIKEKEKRLQDIKNTLNEMRNCIETHEKYNYNIENDKDIIKAKYIIDFINKNATLLNFDNENTSYYRLDCNTNKSLFIGINYLGKYIDVTGTYSDVNKKTYKNNKIQWMPLYSYDLMNNEDN